MATTSGLLLLAILIGTPYLTTSKNLDSLKGKTPNNDTEVKLLPTVLLPLEIWNHSGNTNFHPNLIPTDLHIPEEKKDDSNKTLIQVVIVHNTVIQNNSSNVMPGQSLNTSSGHNYGVAGLHHAQTPESPLETASSEQSTLHKADETDARASNYNVDVDYLNYDPETERSSEDNINVVNNADVKLELNPNSTDLEFRHFNSSYRFENAIPNFSAQILTLSYKGVKKPVLIVQPQQISTTKNVNAKIVNSPKNSNTSMNSNSSYNGSEGSVEIPTNFEETNIPNFSIHFPLHTSSQFQIPRFNFTLPTLFLPGLVFTQNENIKTNKHEVHVSIPLSGENYQPFPTSHAPSGNFAELELLHQPSRIFDNDYESKKPGNNPGHLDSEQNKSDHSKNGSSQARPHANHANVSNENASFEKIFTIVSKETYNNTIKNKNPQRPLATSSIHNGTTHGQQVNLPLPPRPAMATTDYRPLPDNPNSNQPSTSTITNKWNFPMFTQVYNKLFGAGRLDESCDEGLDDEASENEELFEHEKNATLCESDDLCGVTCHRLGFYLGKCVDEASCVCVFKSRPEFGLKLEYFTDKRMRSAYPVYGLCHSSSCRINCEAEGYVTGFCDDACLCGKPWAEKRK